MAGHSRLGRKERLLKKPNNALETRLKAAENFLTMVETARKYGKYPIEI